MHPEQQQTAMSSWTRAKHKIRNWVQYNVSLPRQNNPLGIMPRITLTDVTCIV